ncbi:RDD family protein [Arthrobacter bussei]|uniref:FHA domain-containing protein n=1 Tax=Arthrobacter bussei TaxID=2594179 RepID=A0A7X1NRT0_9MICC|nr:RDD family protein [Arthrobacter bussei]MPY11719.1 FHA domain-containing protein [Arthrobacter bussei]
MAPKLVNALARQRVLAKVLDAVLPALALAVALLIGGRSAAVLTASGLTLLYWIGVLVWESVSGRTPGNVVVGLRTVGPAGGPPGFGAVCVRALALAAASIVPLIGPVLVLVSNLWDRDGQRRGWHDKLVGTFVVDVRAGRDPLVTGGIDGPGVRDVAHGEDAGIGTVPVRADAAVSGPAGDRAEDLVLAGRRAPGRQVGGPTDRFAPPIPAPASGAAGEAPTGVAAAAPATTPTEASATDHAAGVAHRAPAAEAATGPADGADRASAGVTASTPAGGAAAADVAAGATWAPYDGQAAGRAARDPDGSAGVPAVPAQRVLVFDDGTEVDIAGQALIGRNPEPRAGESVNYLINFADLNRSVSKTHVHVGVDDGAVWVTDRGSTNGSFLVDQTGVEQPLHPEVPMLLPSGCGVRFGDRRFTVR